MSAIQQNHFPGYPTLIDSPVTPQVNKGETIQKIQDLFTDLEKLKKEIMESDDPILRIKFQKIMGQIKKHYLMFGDIEKTNQKIQRLTLKFGSAVAFIGIGYLLYQTTDILADTVKLVRNTMNGCYFLVKEV